MRTSRFSVATMALAAGSLSVTPALAENARDFRYLIGSKSDVATDALKRADFTLKDSRDDRFIRHTYWWNGDDKNCLHFQSSNGTVVGVNDADKKDCKQGGGNTTAAVGAVAGVALIAALLASKKKDKDHEQKYSTQDERDFYDSGFYDGAQGNPYNNPRNSTAYSDGYAEGSKQHSSAGTPASFSDLTNTRAAGGMSELERRGFVQVDNFTSGNTRYSIQWREASKQCVQVTIADGRFADLRDIGSHPKCVSSGPVAYSDLHGARAAGGMSALEQRGFQQVDNFTSGNTRYSIQWRPASRQCVQVTIADGRFEDIRSIGTHPKCR